jgi:23S rRNA (adenine2030-N6)-methyltransferase
MVTTLQGYHPAMLSYRHAFHAGNHADVLKHMSLIATLKYLTLKDAGITVIDTHAGAGLYRLDGEFAQKSAEADEGVRKLFSADIFKPKTAAVQASKTGEAIENVAPALQDYYDCIASFNSKGLKVYPGSPFVMHSLLRAGTVASTRDKLKVFELHGADATALHGNMAQLEAGRMITVERADGFDALRALLPPPNKRALVLIDPSYEMKSDYARVSSAVQDAMKRFPTGTYAVWYPIIPRAESHDLPRRLKSYAQQAKKPWLHATLNIGQEDAPDAKAPREVMADGRPVPPKRPGLRESGMFLINPPHTLKASLNAALPQVLAALGRGRGKGFVVDAGG